MTKFSPFKMEWKRRYLVGPLLGLVALLGLLPFLVGLVPVVEFVRERIDIVVHPDEVQVVGRYVYRNPWPFPVAQGLSIPFPVDERHPVPTEVTVAPVTPNAGPLSLRSVLGHQTFELRLRGHEEVQVVVQYRQYAPTRDARYLLTTTQPWRRPLDHAIYTLTPHEVAVTDSNYPLREDAQGVLGFERMYFMPSEDWTFQWEVRPR